MKTILIFIIATLYSINPISSQILCSAPDSVIESYRNDADLLALRAIYRESLAYIDSIEIPSEISDYYLNALLAVYNATHIPERDTIVELLDIHTFPDHYMDRVRVAVDSNAGWLQQLRLNEIPTGYAALDSLMSTYNLSVEEIENWNNWFEWHSVIFKSTRNLNIPALAVAFETLDSVDFAEPWYVNGDGPDINEDLIIIIEPLPGVNLFYTYAWGDCLSGCTGQRTWWLSINGCSVDLLNTFGSPLPFTSVDDVELTPYKAMPNPFHDQILIEGAEGFKYSISNQNGQVVLSGKSLSSTIEHVESLMQGVYFIQIHDGSRRQIFKLVKQ